MLEHVCTSWRVKSGTTPSWLKSFAAARKKPMLEGQAVAEVDFGSVTCYMADELLQRTWRDTRTVGEAR